MKICSIDSCISPHSAKGMCKNHYSQWHYAQNKEKIVRNIKEYQIKNLDKIKQRNIEHYQKNKDEVKSRSIRYYEENKEKALLRQKAWNQNNKDKRRETGRRRKARKFNNYTEKYTEKQVLEKYGSECYLCGIKINMSAPRLVGKAGWEHGLHIEHVIDIALGGPDTLENVRPSHGLCNLTKKPRQVV